MHAMLVCLYRNVVSLTQTRMLNCEHILKVHYTFSLLRSNSHIALRTVIYMLFMESLVTPTLHSCILCCILIARNYEDFHISESP